MDDLARALRRSHPQQHPLAHQAADEIERLEGLLAALTEKYKGVVSALDEHSGTPCEQIQHAEQVEDLTQIILSNDKRILELEAQATAMRVALLPFAKLAYSTTGHFRLNDAENCYDAGLTKSITVGAIRRAEAALSGDAGRRMLDVMEAFQNLWNGVETGAIILQSDQDETLSNAISKIRQALAALK